ncbi:MAG: type 4a pilus biogenesis protein PilO [Deltaproteobacteria bacterium]|nr:type 4a pilus biogenesis protein PilO [Deltaproteobacteria bacterium]
MNGDTLKQLSAIDLSWLKQLRREGIIVLALVACSIFFYKFVYLRNIREIGETENRVSIIRSEIQMASAQSQASDNLNKAVTDASVGLKLMEEKLKSLKERLPSDKHISNILSEFSENDFKKGIRINSIKPLEPETKGELARLPFQISMEARYVSFGDYLERIEKLPRLMIVDNFVIEQKDDLSQALSAQVNLSAYILSYGIK